MPDWLIKSVAHKGRRRGETRTAAILLERGYRMEEEALAALRRFKGANPEMTFLLIRDGLEKQEEVERI